MRRYWRSLPVLILLASCSPVSLYYKEGGSVAALRSNQLDCEVSALEKAPVATQIRQTAPYYVPSRRHCRPDGSCYHSGGFFAGGDLYTVDVNARLRRDLRTQCMAQKGYRRIEVERCPGGQSPAVADDPSHMPPLTESSCARKDAAGDWQIIQPGR